MKKFCYLLIPILTLMMASMAGAARIKDIASVKGVRSNQLIGYGLVIGLDGTGDGIKALFTTQSIVTMLENMGMTIDSKTIRVENVAAVMVTADMPAYVSVGNHIDVIVSSLGDASNLQGGTLLLDEISEMSLGLQAKLLRVLQEKEVERLGGRRIIPLDMRVLATTNRNLREEVAAGRFRRDLLARINTWVFRMPGLSERREDIAPNLDFELERYAKRTGNRVDLNREARDAFLGFATSDRAPWTGNFRDLGGAVTRMATLARGGRIKASDVEAEIDRLHSAWSEDGPEAAVEIPGHLAGRPELAELARAIPTDKLAEEKKGKNVEPGGGARPVYFATVAHKSQDLQEGKGDKAGHDGTHTLQIVFPGRLTRSRADTDEPGAHCASSKG